MDENPPATTNTTTTTTMNPSQASHTQPAQTLSTPSTHPESQPATPWSPADYRAALTHLSQLQAQLTALRPAIPTLLEPLLRPADGKELMFAQVRKAAVGVDREVRGFRAAFEGERTGEVLGRAGMGEGGDGAGDLAGDEGARG